MTKLYVIRHAAVTVDFRIPAAQWRISDEGRQDLRALVLNNSWNEIAAIYHSPEPKAIATAGIISQMTGCPAMMSANLRELSMPVIPLAEEFVRRVGAYLEGFTDPEFELWDEAQERIVNCIRSIMESEHGKSMAIVSHGRILSVFFSHVLRRRITVEEWQSIKFPDLSVVDWEQGLIERGYFSSACDN